MFYEDWPFDVACVETLVLSEVYYEKLQEEEWTSMLEELPALKTLRLLSLGASNTYELLLALSYYNEQGGPDTGPDQSFSACPLLSSLELYDVEAFLSLPSMICTLVETRYSFGNLREVELFNVGGINSESPWISMLERCLPGLRIWAE